MSYIVSSTFDYSQEELKFTIPPMKNIHSHVFLTSNNKYIKKEKFNNRMTKKEIRKYKRIAIKSIKKQLNAANIVFNSKIEQTW